MTPKDNSEFLFLSPLFFFLWRCFACHLAASRLIGAEQLTGY